MPRGHQKIQSQAKNHDKKAKLEDKKGHKGTEQKKAAEKTLNYICFICKSQMQDRKTYKQHFGNKHPKSKLPVELKEV